MMKYIRYGLLVVSFIISFLNVSCTNDDSKKIEGKWQLVNYEDANGEVFKAENLFYNFQKGSFSIICLVDKDVYDSFFGNYVLQDDKISIILLPEYIGEVYDKYIGWDNWRREFEIVDLTTTKLYLKSNDVYYRFRRY